MDARDYYLALYEHTHFVRHGKAQLVLDDPSPTQWRTVLPDHNSIAWIVWHLARGEDWTIQTILQGREQLLTRDGWAARMGVAEPGFGGGMPRAAMIALSEQIDLAALRGYYLAVTAATQAYMRAFDFDTLDAPFDVQRRLALASDAQGPSPLLRAAFGRWTTPRVWIDVMTVVDVAHHFEEAEHVLRLLSPDQAYP
jgi:DinB family protein